MNRNPESSIQHPESRIQDPESGSPYADERVVAWLRNVPAPTVSHDLAPEILAKVKSIETVSRPSYVSHFTSHVSRLTFHISRLSYPLAAAAAAVLLLGGLWLSSSPADPGRQAVAWLCQTQEPDGSWSAAKWGGDKHFEVALTGLSLMTLLNEPSGVEKRWAPTSGRRQMLESPGGIDRARRARSTCVANAIDYLIKAQRADGHFGELFSGTPYNHGIATLALAKAYEQGKNEAIRQALDKAVAAICTNQYADGGWGYHNEAHPASNLSITLWQIEALRLVSQQGWPVKARVERGLRWMAGVASDDGSFGYQRSGDTPGGASQTLTAMGAMSLLDPAHIGLVTPGRRQAIKAQMQRLASTPGPDMDYYRRYFLAAALKKMDEKPASLGLAAIRQELRTRQIKQGSDAGSWTADDRWGSSGGRIYATALASLTLR